MRCDNDDDERIEMVGVPIASPTPAPVYLTRTQTAAELQHDFKPAHAHFSWPMSFVFAISATPRPLFCFTAFTSTAAPRRTPRSCAPRSATGEARGRVSLPASRVTRPSWYSYFDRAARCVLVNRGNLSPDKRDMLRKGSARLPPVAVDGAAAAPFVPAVNASHVPTAARLLPVLSGARHVRLLTTGTRAGAPTRSRRRTRATSWRRGARRRRSPACR